VFPFVPRCSFSSAYIHSLHLDKAFDIATQNSIPVYDALYIAQAITHNVPLATSDKRQAEVAEKLKVQAIFIP